MALSLLLAGAVILVIHFCAGEAGWVPNSLDPDITWAGAAGRAALLGAGHGVTLLAHELGHVLAYTMLGTGWKRLTLGTGMSVQTHRSCTHKEQVLVTFMGPAVEIALGTLIAVSATTWSLAHLLGCAAIANGALNLLPLYHRIDGYRLTRALFHTLRGRGSAKRA